jgi:hypothetical protein
MTWVSFTFKPVLADIRVTFRRKIDFSVIVVNCAVDVNPVRGVRLAYTVDGGVLWRAIECIRPNIPGS